MPSVFNLAVRRVNGGELEVSIRDLDGFCTCIFRCTRTDSVEETEDEESSSNIN